MIRALIADDHDVVRSGLKDALSHMGGYAVVAEASDGFEVLAHVARLPVDLVIMDIAMGQKNGMETLAELKHLYPKIDVLIFSMHAEDEYALKAMELGASGYVTKDSPVTEIVKALHMIAKGARYVSPTLAQLLLANPREPGSNPLPKSLTTREDAVMRAIAAGKSLTQIANDMRSSPKTVTSHRSRILEKMSFKNNADLIRYVARLESRKPERPFTEIATLRHAVLGIAA